MAIMSILAIGFVFFFIVIMFVLGIGAIIAGITLKIVNTVKVRRGGVKSRAISIATIIVLSIGTLLSLPLLTIAGCMALT